MGLTRVGSEEEGQGFQWIMSRGQPQRRQVREQASGTREGVTGGALGAHPSCCMGGSVGATHASTHTFWMWQYFLNVLVLDTGQWPCTIMLLSFICIIDTFFITFLSLDIQQYHM